MSFYKSKSINSGYSKVKEEIDATKELCDLHYYFRKADKKIIDYFFFPKLDLLYRRLLIVVNIISIPIPILLFIISFVAKLIPIQYAIILSKP
jgi:hypothetical protein